MCARGRLGFEKIKKGNLMSILIKIGYYLFFIAIVAIGVLLLATMFPIEGNIQVKIVKSGSMEPTISTGSIVIIKPETSYAVGDIVTFGEDTKEKIPTTHRIIGDEIVAGKVVYTTQGDANDDPDPNKLPAGDVIGKVVVAVPYAGFVIDFARQPLGFVFLVVIPAGAIILDELWSIFVEFVRMSRRRKMKHMRENLTASERQYVE